MAIIIDTCCLGDVFSRNENFDPVFKWIFFGNGIIVTGGDKYKYELSQTRYFHIIRLLYEIGKVYKGDDLKINDLERKISKGVPKKFNDAHLVAISVDTKCILICSKDTESIPYVTDPKLFSKLSFIPKYYSSKKNKKLLDNKNIHNQLRSKCLKIKKSDADNIILQINKLFS